MMPPRPRPRLGVARHTGRACGFSLLEIIVVLSLMALISASIVPVFSSSLSSLKHKNALRNIMSLIQFVQEKSVCESQVYRICFDTENNTYWVMQPAEEPTEDVPFEIVHEAYGRRRKLPRGLEFGAIRARTDRVDQYEYFECYPNGASDKLDIPIDYPNERSQSARIVVKGMLGRVELEE